MKIPKDFYRRLEGLKAKIHSLVDHTVVLVFIKENKASYYSEDGKDRYNYYVRRQKDESEAGFHLRAEEEARKRFPKAKLTLIPHAAYQGSDIESDGEEKIPCDRVS